MYTMKVLTVALTTYVGSHALVVPSKALAQSEDIKFGQSVAGVTYGPYVRLELGGANHDLSNAFWLPPGGSDPRVNFDAVPDDDVNGFGAAAIGYDWQNGFRADVSLFSTGDIGITAPCSSASNGTPCNTHADITDATLNSTGIMGNLFYAPMEARGSYSVFQPFVVASLGVARNEVGEWTRTKNPANNTFGTGNVRTFESNSSTDLAWSLGVGASLQLTRPGEWPVILETAYRYYDYGTGSGGEDPIGSGKSARQGFTVDHTDHVISIGIRVPLQRY